MIHPPTNSNINNRERKRVLWIFLFASVHKPSICYWCERKLKFEGSTFDHNPPLSFSNSDINRGVISCYSCNHDRVNRKLGYPPTPDYLEGMRQQQIDQSWKSHKFPQSSHLDEEKKIVEAWEKDRVN